MPNPEEATTAAERAICDCGPCMKRRGQPHNVRPGTIHRYDSQPRNGWQVRRTPAELAEGSNAPTFGIELETACPSGGRIADLPGIPALPDPYDFPMRHGDPAYTAARTTYNVAVASWQTRNQAHAARERARLGLDGNLTAEEAAGMSQPVGLWHPKHDASVSGPEFASQPASLAYWRAHRPRLATMFRALLHGGMRSHDGDTAGMHVNIGTTGFADADHLYRFASLVVANPRWATRMAQRTHQSVASWARFDALSNATTRRQWADSVARNGYCALSSRYSVLNAPGGGRVEFRLPRGTIRLDRFFAKLEWTAAMVEYSRDGSRPVRVSGFCQWAAASGEYPDLAQYLVERFPRRLDGSVAA